MAAKKGEDREELTPTYRRQKTCTTYCCYKWFVFIHGLFFLIVGLLLLIVGIYVLSAKSDYSSINDYLDSPAILAIIVGFVMLITAIVGIIGAIKEHIILLKIFLAIIIIVFLLQVIIGIIAYIYREEAISIVNGQMKFAVKDYHNDANIAKGVDSVQENFECCGINGYNDWEKNEEYKCGASSHVQCGVPDSCCQTITNECGLNIRSNSTVSALRKLLNRDGCSHKFLVWLDKNLDLVGALALGMALPQVLGIFITCAFIIKVRDYRRLFKYRKRAYQDS